MGVPVGKAQALKRWKQVGQHLMFWATLIFKSLLSSNWCVVLFCFYYSNHGKPSLQRYDIMERSIVGSNAETALSSQFSRHLRDVSYYCMCIEDVKFFMVPL